MIKDDEVFDSACAMMTLLHAVEPTTDFFMTQLCECVVYTICYCNRGSMRSRSVLASCRALYQRALVCDKTLCLVTRVLRSFTYTIGYS